MNQPWTHVLSTLAGAIVTSALFTSSTLPLAGAGGARAAGSLTAEQEEILSHLSIRHVPDGRGGTAKTILVSGVNLQLVNGFDQTATTNGLGNLIVGYNELGNGHGDARIGSHNVVVGKGNGFAAYGGLVAGEDQLVTGAYGSAVGGTYNIVSGSHAVALGGNDTRVKGMAAVVCGGAWSQAAGDYSVTSGGFINVAGGAFATVSGGESNVATGQAATVSGGRGNRAEGDFSSVGGGASRTAVGTYDWVAGGLFEED